MNQTQSRFVISKNAIDFLQSTPDLIPKELKEGFAKKEDFGLVYEGESDYKMYSRIDAPLFRQILSTTPDIHLLLQNILYDRIKENVVSFFQLFFNSPLLPSSLVLVEHQAVECAVIGKIFEKVGCKNTAYSLKKSLFFNSPAHTLEGILVLLAFEKSPFLQALADEIIKSFEGFATLPKDLYIYCSENEMPITAQIDTIDSYLKTQIGYKYPPVILSLKNIIEVEFLSSKHIKNICVFSDFNQKKSLYEDCKAYGESFALSQNKYSSTPCIFFGMYERYVGEQNTKFFEYRKDIDEKVVKNVRGKHFQNTTPEEKAWVQNKDKIPLYAFIPYGISILVLLMYLTAQSIGATTSSSGSTSSTNGGSNYYYFGGSNWGGSLGNTSVGNSTSKSTVNSIKSFGGGGFSKSSG